MRHRLSLFTYACSALFLALPIVAAKPSSGCGKAPTLAAGNHSMTVNGVNRWYLLRLPENYNNSQPYRLIFTLHAAGGTADQVANGVGGYLGWYGLPPLVNDMSSAIFVSLNALSKNWYEKVPDGLTFISNIVNDAKAQLCIDEGLDFATGLSSGAEMLYSIGCSMAKTFRGLASLSGNNAFPCVGGKDPIAFYGQHGVSDNVLPISDARDERDQFVRNNGCTIVPISSATTPAVGSGTHVKTVYKGCKEGYPVTWIEFDGGHTGQPKDKGSSATYSADETWAFFSQFK